MPNNEYVPFLSCRGSRNFFVAFFTLLLFLLIFAHTSHSAGTKSVRMFLAPFMDFAPIFIALEEGFFAEEGILIEPVKFSKPSNAIPALLTDELDVAPVLISAATINAIGKGGGAFKAVAGMGHLAAGKCSTTALVARLPLSMKPLTSEDIQGKVFEVPPISVHRFFLERWLQRFGLTIDDIKTVYLKDAIIGEALERGSLDFSVLSEPWITRLTNSGHGKVVLSVENELPDYQLAVILFGPSLLKDDPETGKKFIAAYIKGIRQFQEGSTQRNLSILAKHTGMDIDFLQSVCLPAINENGRINFQSIGTFQQWAFEKGYIDSVLNEASFWDPQFVESAAVSIDQMPK